MGGVKAMMKFIVVEVSQEENNSSGIRKMKDCRD